MEKFDLDFLLHFVDLWTFTVDAKKVDDIKKMNEKAHEIDDRAVGVRKDPEKKLRSWL